jgi:hypothetical protein
MEVKVVTLREVKERLEIELIEIEEDIDLFGETLDLDDAEAKEKYDEWIDELHGPIRIGYSVWNASYILEQISPTDYRIGFADWTGELDEDDLRGFPEYRELLEKKEEIEEELEEIEVAIEEAETDEAMQEDDE